MKYDPAKHHRRSIRLKGYDYAQAGAYFVTLCTKGRECVLDDPVVTGITTDVWCALPNWFPTIALDEFVVMPNHVHLIVWLNPPSDDVGATLAVVHHAVGPDRARAPTDDNDVIASDRARASTDDNVGAILAVAHNAIAPDRAGASLAPTDWVIPRAEKVNLKPRLGAVIGAFQSLVFTIYLDWIETHDPTRRAKFWQRNYYEHIIRNDRELNAIRRYIRHNPAQWALDRDNSDNICRLPSPTHVEEYLQDVQARFKE
jgi:REP element-mobilizing transposase RayT